MCARAKPFRIPIVILIGWMAINAVAWAAMKSPADYSDLIVWMQETDAEEPLMALGEPEQAFSDDAHQSNLAYFTQHPDLLTAIKTELKSTELSWKLIDARQRLLAVPEKRTAYAVLFEAYCHAVIDYVLAATGLESPYSAIITLGDGEFGVQPADAGLTALLVHNLAEEFVYTYSFQGSGEGSVAVELNQKIFVGEVGAYASTLVAHADGRVAFVPNPLTIWQNSASNPYTALMVPVEETFHVLLRDATEQAIKSELDADRKKHQDLEGIVAEWVAVEEAISGGLVNNLLPGFLSSHFETFKADWIEADLAEKMQRERYRYLQRGIQLVHKMGATEAVKLYRASPSSFRDLLTDSTDAGA